MAETHVGPLPEGTKRCRVCAEPINETATRCIHCQSEQGGLWRRVGFSSIVLSLLIALLSVSIILIGALKEVLTPKNSQLLMSFQFATGNGISFLVNNAGVRAGTVLGAVKVQFQRVGGDPKDKLKLPLIFDAELPQDADEESLVIEPSKSKLITYFLGVPSDVSASKAWLLGPPEFPAEKDECTITFRITDFLGQSEDRPLKVDCARLSPLRPLLTEGKVPSKKKGSRRESR